MPSFFLFQFITQHGIQHAFTPFSFYVLAPFPFQSLMNVSLVHFMLHTVYIITFYQILSMWPDISPPHVVETPIRASIWQQHCPPAPVRLFTYYVHRAWARNADQNVVARIRLQIVATYVVFFLLRLYRGQLYRASQYRHESHARGSAQTKLVPWWNAASKWRSIRMFCSSVHAWAG